MKIFSTDLFQFRGRKLTTGLLLFFSACLAGFSQPCEVLYSASRIIVDGRKMTKSEIIVLQVNNRKGEHYTHFSFPYEPDNRLNSLKAQIEDLEGNIIRKLKKNEIKHSNYSAYSLYNEDYLASFDVKHNQYPYRIRIEAENSFPEYLGIADWIPVHHVDIPTRKAILVLELPLSMQCYHREHHAGRPVITEMETSRIYTWEVSYENIIKEEAFAPPKESLLPRVEVYPQDFIYGENGSYRSWSDFGQWAYRLNRNKDQLTPPEARQVRLLTKDLQSPEEKIRVLYHYLQDNTRYIEVTMDIGGYEPYPAEYVCENKYGDCKALTIYLQALLKEAGIPSYYTLVYAGEKNIPLSPDFTEQHFNHVILCVPLNQDTLWLETTSKNLPFGYVHNGIQDRYALLIDSLASRLVKIPSLKAEDARNDRHLLIRLDGNGNATLDLRMLARGQFFEYLNNFDHRLTEHEKRQSINDLFSFPGYELENWEITSKDRDRDWLQVTSELSLSNYGKQYGKDMIVKLPALNIPDFEIPSRRSLPVQIDIPWYTVDTIRIDGPEGFTLETFPEDKYTDSPYGLYEVHFETLEETLYCYRRFMLRSGLYPLSEYDQFYSFIEEAGEYERANVLVFTK